MALVVKSMVGEYAKKKGVRVSGDFYDALDKHVAMLVDGAVDRCKGNKRQTLYPFDL
ncbi:MAG: DUF1931 domain-containing protein [Candidatus Micrarchaeota archaeon]